MSAGEYELLQLEASLYSGKARAYLRYKGVPFRQRTATLWVYKRIILPRTGKAMIPVLLTPEGEALQDTTVIIDALERRFPERGVYPPGPRQRLAALLLELYGDEWLLLPAMHYRWGYLREHGDFIREEFGRVVWPKGPALVRRAIGRQLGRRFHGFVPLLGITPETAPAIEAAWEETLDVLNHHFARLPYLLGGRPSIGDFGLMGPLYAHLGRDPYPRALMQRRAPNVWDWVTRMNETTPPVGDWLAGDAVPETLDPLLRRQFAEQVPVLTDAAARLYAWAEGKRAGERVPRSIGRHAFRVGERVGEREVITYSLWMWQRPLDAYQALDDDGRAAVDGWLARIDQAGALARPLPQRLELVHHRCVLGRRAPADEAA
ncbi:MAG: glutathione S-transferase [Myxococcales bacterium]|nr:glutathione S-transferase [Myxococcales bacterium]